MKQSYNIIFYKFYIIKIYKNIYILYYKNIFGFSLIQ